MPLLQRLRDIFMTSSVAINNTDPLGFALLSRQAPPTRFAQNYLRAYSEMPWLRAVMGRISTSVAAQPWVLYQRVRASGRTRRSVGAVPNKAQRDAVLKAVIRRQEWQEVASHPLLDVLEHGNSLLDGMSNRILTQLYLDLVGESFWIIEPAERDAGLTGLWPIPPTWVEDIPQAKQPYYKVRFPTGISFDLPPQYMIHLRQADPADPYRRGSGVAQALSDELDIDEYAAKFMRQWFFNSARPDLLLTGDGLGEAAMKVLEEKWEQKTRGFWNAFKPLWLNKKIDVHQLQSNLRDMDLSSLRAAERDIVLQVTGVNPEILGVLDSSNRATIDASDLHFARYCLSPRLEFLRVIYNRHLVPLYGDNLYLDYVNPVPEDREYKLKVYSAAPHAFTIDEWRSLAEDEPLPDNLGQARYGALNLVEIGTARLPAMRDTGEERLLSDAHQKSVPVRKQLPNDTAQGELIQHIADGVEPGMRRAFLAAVEDLRESLNVEDMAALIRYPDQLLAIIPWERYDTGLQELVQQSLKALEQSGTAAAEALSHVDIAIDFSLGQPEAVTYASQHGGALIREVSDETRLAVRSIVTDGLTTGEAGDVIAERIREHIGLTNRQAQAVERLRQQLIADGVPERQVASRVRRYAEGLLDLRAEMIARTETITASNAGHQAAWDQAVREGKMDANQWRKVWIVTPDDRLDQRVCAPMPFMAANQDVRPNGMFTTPQGAQIPGPTAHPG